jgi:DNA-binding response OmpR family regulator
MPSTLQRTVLVVEADAMLRDLLVHTLRASETTRAIPVVLLSGLVPSADGALLADSVLDKPFDSEILLAHLNRVATAPAGVGVAQATLGTDREGDPHGRSAPQN